MLGTAHNLSTRTLAKGILCLGVLVAALVLALLAGASASAAEPVLGLLWKILPRSHTADIVKLTVFAGILAIVAVISSFGRLPRTRVITPGEWAVSD